MNVKTTKTIAKVITLSLITSTMIHATNGDNLISVGAKARGMGGIGIAMAHGAESALANPALITSVESTEIGFGGTLFMPDIKTDISGMGEHTSDADTNMIPSVSIAHKIDDNWYIGIGIWGTAGMGVDYSNVAMTQTDVANMNMVTNLQLMSFGLPIAYKTGGLSLAVTPLGLYGNLDIHYQAPQFDPQTGAPIGFASNGAGLAQDFGFGFNVGLAYDFSANGVTGLTFGAMYKSSIEMDYDHQLTTALKPFLQPGETISDLLPAGDTLEQPEEYGVGLAYEMGQHTFAFDYKKIKWSEAKGYADFGWDDSDVYAVGYQYTENEWTVRLGYNYASSAVVEGVDDRLDLFNLLGFPANAERHYTVGGSYAVSDQLTVDLAYVYADESSDTFDLAQLAGMGINSITTTHAEDSVSFQLAYKF